MCKKIAGSMMHYSERPCMFTRSWSGAASYPLDVLAKSLNLLLPYASQISPRRVGVPRQALLPLSACTDKELSPLHVLTRVHVVCRDRPQLAGLHHVALTIDAFLYHPQHFRKTLADAVAEDNLHLLRRLLSDATSARRSGGDGGGVSTVAQHPLFVGLQVTKAAQVAVSRQTSSPSAKPLLQCLHAFDREAVGASEVFQAAAAVGNLELLVWL
ncbi:hypothetical protein Gpo141_00012932, partial [Globisporangium polare]